MFPKLFGNIYIQKFVFILNFLSISNYFEHLIVVYVLSITKKKLNLINFKPLFIIKIIN